MDKTTEQTISVLIPKGASNIRVKILDTEGKVDITFNNPAIAEYYKKYSKEYLDEYFPVVKASTLSLKDEFLKYEPESEKQSEFKKRLIKAIKSGLSDFRAQRMDPSLDVIGNICYKAGMRPAINKSCEWWEKNAKRFFPEKESRVGTIKERIAFLGLLIKYLIEEQGYTISEAWKAICDQSEDLGHYRDSENSKGDFEATGSRKLGEWYDLANTFKIIIDDVSGDFLIVGGDYYDFGFSYPLANVVHTATTRNFLYSVNDYSVGWLVLSV